jgi:hypothetical protein
MHAHLQTLSEHLLATDPQVVERIQGGGVTVAGVVVDPFLQGAQGGALLVQSMTREANILAYNDVFRFVTILALATALYVAYVIAFNTVRRRRLAIAGAQP